MIRTCSPSRSQAARQQRKRGPEHGPKLHGGLVRPTLQRSPLVASSSQVARAGLGAHLRQGHAQGAWCGAFQAGQGLQG